mmetsp:Transcript_14077/g.21086  ORF Transcript_14077/g.21086 Transcript_14077/m.21086 type:complete len:368 (-) Transcript_14077:459-1562(-)
MNNNASIANQLLCHAAPFPTISSVKRRTCSDIPSHALVKNLELKKSSRINDFLKVACASSILSHVIFSRGIIPCPADHLLSAKERIKNSKNMTTTTVAMAKKRKRSDTVRERKYEKHGEQLQAILSALDIIFCLNTCSDGNDENKTDNLKIAEESAVKAVMITLGPSFSSPREQYLIRFHEWDAVSKSKSPSITVPSDTQRRLGQEMGRRSVRELICGSLQEEYSSMFELRGCNGGNGVKVNVACLVSEDAVQRLLHPASSNDAILDVEPATAQPKIDVLQLYSINQGIFGNLHSSTIPFTVDRRLEVREPRMYSKSKGIHRPFAVLDVIPALKPSGYRGNREAPKFEQKNTDVWISLRPYIKGFRI